MLWNQSLTAELSLLHSAPLSLPLSRVKLWSVYVLQLASWVVKPQLQENFIFRQQLTWRGRQVGILYNNFMPLVIKASPKYWK